MKNHNKLIYLLFLIFITASYSSVQAIDKPAGCISGHLEYDTSWSPVIYLSYIPTLEERNRMSADMIIGSAEIDENGEFFFDISFLPEESNLFRLHLVKQGDSPYSLIIGGKDENHMFLIANGHSVIHIENSAGGTLFEDVTFKHSDENVLLNEVNIIKQNYDSTQMIVSPSKRQLMQQALESQLRLIADTCPDALVGLYAIYNSNFEENYLENKSFYKQFLKKWRKEDSLYYVSFREQIEVRSMAIVFGLIILLISVFVLVYFSFWRKKNSKSSLIGELSVQERKVFSYLQQGLSNQQISDECNIGISTVKTHVSNIYAKLGIKSRKEALNFQDQE